MRECVSIAGRIAPGGIHLNSTFSWKPYQRDFCGTTHKTSENDTVAWRERALNVAPSMYVSSEAVSTRLHRRLINPKSRGRRVASGTRDNFSWQCACIVDTPRSSSMKARGKRSNHQLTRSTKGVLWRCMRARVRSDLHKEIRRAHLQRHKRISTSSDRSRR